MVHDFPLPSFVIGWNPHSTIPTSQNWKRNKSWLTYTFFPRFVPATRIGFEIWLVHLIFCINRELWGLVWVFTSANANCTVTNYWGHATTVFGKISVRRGNSNQFFLYSSKKATVSRWLFHSIIQHLEVVLLTTSRYLKHKCPLPSFGYYS